MCACDEPDAHFDQFRVWRSLPADETDGRFADVSVLECSSCHQLWLRYHVEYESISTSGRWARGRINAARAAVIGSEEVSVYLAGLAGYIYGGSHFGGVCGTGVGPMQW